MEKGRRGNERAQIFFLTMFILNLQIVGQFNQRVNISVADDDFKWSQ
jgi:hypothetical protein